MTQDQPSRLDRIEAAIEAMQQEQVRERQEQAEKQRQRDQEFDRQMQLNAEFRTRQEIQSQQLDQLIDIAELTLNSVQSLRDGFNQHRSDGHGA